MKAVAALAAIALLGVTHEAPLIAVCRDGGGNVAIAPCFYQVAPVETGVELFEIQATPAGRFTPRDGRKMDVDAWHIDAAQAAAVIAAFRANQTPLVIDYEHQTLQAEDNGQPAPAAGWIRDMEWREGSGLWLKVELTQRARGYVANGEYKYFSPVFAFDRKSGAVLRLLMGALTNNPAIDGMAQVAQRAAARFDLTSSEDSPMLNKNLLAIALCMAISTDGIKDDDALQKAITDSIKASEDQVAALRQQLGLKDTAAAEEIGTAVAALKSKADAAGTGDPDPAKFVPVSVVEDLKTQVAALSAGQQGRDIDDLVKPALEDGRLLPAQEGWARELGKKDIASLRAYLKDAQPIAALRGTQTEGQQPVVDNEHKLTAAELAVCSATGTDPKDFAAAKAAA